MILHHQVEECDAGKRFVDILKHTVGMSGLMTKKVRLYGSLLVNGIPSRMIDRSSAGDIILVSYRESAEAEPAEVTPRGGIGILYSDRHIIVAVKPAGIVTHPTSTHPSGTLVDHFPDNEMHPVHRLDRETSGLLLIARDPHSQHVLSRQHGDRAMEKEYLGILHGSLSPETGVISAPIARKKGSIMLRRVDPQGSEAMTCYRTEQHFPRAGASLVRFSLLTGRTHQIRVHSLYMGHPIIGDGLYGVSSRDNGHYSRSAFLDRDIGRQALHAASLTFSHPITGERMHFESPLPEDMESLLARIRALDAEDCGGSS